MAAHPGLVLVVVGGLPAARAAALDERMPASAPRREVDPRRWPFLRHLAALAAGTGPTLYVARDLDRAFPAGQAGGTRLVLTQPAYLMQRWLDWIASRGDGSALLAEADRERLRAAAPDAFTRRGPWRDVELVDLGPAETEAEAGVPPADAAADDLLERAFVTRDPGERLALCRRAVDAAVDSAPAQLALASASMEVQDLDAAQAAVERALALDPDWEAAHYEHGKLWLRRDDLERAAAAFAEAARLMPSFAPALSNLGATLGELDRPEEALAAFQQALRSDPDSHTLVNNIGVLARELGRLRESEAAFRRVIALAPEFVFGHYNLGHTLFLQGRYQAALSAYAEGQRRDPEKNPRQACRLAVTRLAAGDADGALRDLRRFTAALPADQKREILAEAQEILWALLTDQPALAGWRTVADAVQSELEALP